MIIEKDVFEGLIEKYGIEKKSTTLDVPTEMFIDWYNKIKDNDSFVDLSIENVDDTLTFFDEDLCEYWKKFK